MTNRRKREAIARMRNYWNCIASNEEVEKEYKRLKERKENGELVSSYEIATWNVVRGIHEIRYDK